MTTPKQNIVDLLDCPFCGGKPYFTKSVNGTNMNYIGCSSCGFQFKVMRTDIPLDSPMTKDIVAAWNQRIAT